MASWYLCWPAFKALKALRLRGRYSACTGIVTKGAEGLWAGNLGQGTCNSAHDVIASLNEGDQVEALPGVTACQPGIAPGLQSRPHSSTLVVPTKARQSALLRLSGSSASEDCHTRTFFIPTYHSQCCNQKVEVLAQQPGVVGASCNRKVEVQVLNLVVVLYHLGDAAYTPQVCVARQLPFVISTDIR
eukprot:493360-Rhodomonas_salina.1